MDQSSTVKLHELRLPSRNAKKQRTMISFPVGKLVSFIILTVFCIIWISPFIFLFTVSLRNQTDAMLYPKEILYPHSGYSFESYEIILLGKYPETSEQHITTGVTWRDLVPWILNSCGVAIGGTIIHVLVAAFAAYAFTFLDFKYRNILFTFLIFTMVIPGAATTLGNQTTIFGLKWNKVPLVGLILPGIGGVYGMYLIKTFFSGIPKDLIESAKMDGYSDFKIFFKIVLPLGKTVLLVQGLFGFMGGWNDLIWPQMLYGADVKRKDLWTLQVGMAYLLGKFRSSNTIGVSLAGGVICIVPVLIVYLFAANKIVEGMASAGVKR